MNLTTYQYRIYAFNSIINSDTVYSDTVTIIVTSVGSTSLTFPKVYSLSQNYPNPFNPSTIIKYDVAKESFVSLKIYDMLGREVKTLVNEDKPAGSYEIKFNASNLSSGIYFYRIKAGEFVQSKKMILLK